MAIAITWVDEGDRYYSDELSNILRTNVQPLVKFRQFADVKDATKKGLHRGNKFRWNRYGDVGTQGREIGELQNMPQTNFSSDQAELTVTEYGNSVPYTGKLEKLGLHSVVDIIDKALRNDARKAFDIAAYNQFDLTPLKVQPTSGTSSTAVTFVENGNVASANDIAYGADHAKAIADGMEERNIPPYSGDDYVAISHPTTFRPIKNDLETINQYTESGIGRIYRGEIGRYEQIRHVKQNQIPKGGAEDSTTFDPYTRTADAWDNGKSSWIFFFGDDTVAEAIVVPEEIIAKIPTDFGRSKAIAWYYLGGFGIVHDGGGPTGGSNGEAAQCRIVKWDSNS